MIRIEIRDHRGHIVEVVNSPLIQIKIGRATTNQIIIPDFSVDLEALEIHFTPDEIYQIIIQGEKFNLKHSHELELGNYHLKIIDLRDFNSPPPLSERIKHKEWVTTAILYFSTVIVLLLDNWIEKTKETDLSEYVKGFLIILVGFGILNIILSLASRILNGEYKVWKLGNILLTHSLIGYFLLMNCFGLRWFVPFFKFREVYNLSYSMLAASLIWFLGHHIFSQVKNTIRLGIFFFLLSVGIILQGIRLFPKGDTRLYFTPETSPPRVNFLESKAISADEFLKQL